MLPPMIKARRRRPLPAPRRAPGLAAAVPWAVAALAACGPSPSYYFDSRPIGLVRAPSAGAAPGGLLALLDVNAPVTAAPDRGRQVLVDTAFPVTIAPAGPCGSGRRGGRYQGTLRLGDARATPEGKPLRAIFSDVDMLDLCPGAVGDPQTRPYAVIGGSLLHNFSVEFDLPPPPAAPTVTFWDRQPGRNDFLSTTGWAVIDFRLRGGGQVKTAAASDLSLPATRVVLRACAAPAPFSPDDPAPVCASGELFRASTGVNLTLVLGTGVGPLVLSESAWRRVAATLGRDPAAGELRPLWIAQRQTSIGARWVTVPRLALVDRQASERDNPGPCAELARARRIEWAERHAAEGSCIQPCDAAGGRAEDSAGYLEVGGDVEAAIVADDDEVLAGLRADVGAAEPDISGIVGAGVLTGTRFEVDYQRTPDQRFVVTCRGGAPRDRCHTAPSCPGIPDDSQKHRCFGQPERGRVPICRGPS
jgi:hypothetical protein